MRILPRPDQADVSFHPPITDFQTKPVGVIADTLNNEHIDHHRSSNYTSSKYFLHVSDLIQSGTTKRFCPRNAVLVFLEERGKSYIKKIPPGMRLLHTIGHAIQKHITNDFIERSPFSDKVWGNWGCRCGYTHVNYALKPKSGAYTCTRCGLDPDVYEEISIYHSKYHIIGHPDLIIVWNKLIHVYEIKTIDRKGVVFDLLNAPLGDHTLQGSVYYWLMKDMYDQERDTLKKYPGAFNPSIPFDVDPFVNYIYADRSNENLFKRNFYKEFTKRASPFTRIEPMFDNAKLVMESLEKKILPTRLELCKSVISPRAKACNTCTSCFSRTKDRFNV